MKLFLFLCCLLGFFSLSCHYINEFVFSVIRELAHGTSKQEIRTALKNICPQNIIKKINNSMMNDSLCTVFNSENDEYILKMIKPGKVPGSYAVYYIKINGQGKTVEVIKDTFNHKKAFVHRKVKKAAIEEKVIF